MTSGSDLETVVKQTEFKVSKLGSIALDECKEEISPLVATLHQVNAKL